jgi:Sigma-70 region 2/Sigma-70 region 3
VEMHLPLVRYFASRYTGRNEPFDDLAQAGALGLIKAVDRFDPHRGVAFSAFAAPTSLGEIRRHFRDRTWAVHVHRWLQVLTGEVDTCLRDMTQQLGLTPSVAELADRMRLPPERIRQSLQSNAAYRATSLATPVGSSGTLGDLRGAEDPGYDTVDTHDALGCALARLPERDAGCCNFASTATCPRRRSLRASGSPRRTSPGCSAARSPGCSAARSPGSGRTWSVPANRSTAPSTAVPPGSAPSTRDNRAVNGRDRPRSMDITDGLSTLQSWRSRSFA